MQAGILFMLAREALHSIAASVLPATCRLCENALLRLSRTPVCDACLAAMLPAHDTLCMRCGEALGFEAAWDGTVDSLCRPCRLAPPAFEQAIAYASYEGALRQAIHALKFEGVRRLQYPLGKLLAETLARHRPLWPDDMLVIAVPLFRRKRAFNQSVALAQGTLLHLKKTAPSWKLTPAHQLLVRTRPTASQFQLSLSARRRNVRGAFSVTQPQALRGRHILLLDDIYTSGATARECARILRRAGAASVRVATLARTQSQTATLWHPTAEIRNSARPPQGFGGE